MDYLPLAALTVALIMVIWIFASIDGHNFDPAIMPKYPPAAIQEQMNTAITRSYPMYPRLPYGETLTVM
jgi:hypothetical protein